MNETDKRYFQVISGGVTFIIHPDDVTKINVDAAKLKVNKAYTASQQCFLVPTKLGSFGLQIVNIVNKVEDIEITYSAFGYVPEDSGYIKSIQEIEANSGKDKLHKIH